MRDFRERFLPLKAPEGPAGGATSTPAPSAPATPEPAGGGSSAVPASTPASPSDGDSGFTFPDNFGDDLDDAGVTPTPAPTPAPATPAATPAAPATPAAATPAPATPPAAPAATPAQPSAPAPTAAEPSQPSIPTPSAGDPLALAASLDQHRDAALAHLAQTRFALSEEELTELESNVATAVPKLLSRVFLESQTQMMRFVAQAIPQMFQQQQSVSRANNAAEKKFFDSHKELDINNPQHKQLVAQYAHAYRSVNPQAKLDDVIANVGVMVKAALGIASAAPAAAPTAPTLPAGAPAAVPFRPAVGTGAPAPTPVVASDNPWEGMQRDYEDE